MNDVIEIKKFYYIEESMGSHSEELRKCPAYNKHSETRSWLIKNSITVRYKCPECDRWFTLAKKEEEIHGNTPCARRDSEKTNLIRNAIKDLVSDLLYYDRKEDEDLKVGDIEVAVKSGKLSTIDMVDIFRIELNRRFPKDS